MRAVVIGGSGQIGGWLLHHLAHDGHEAIGTYATREFPGLTRLDAAASDASAWVAAQRPDAVFYPAGFTWVDGCEKDPERARAANRAQPCAIARAAADAGARFVYFSTDYLFDGRSGPYDETDAACPLNVYGRAKLEAERELLNELGDRVLIARTCWVYGPERQGKNFAYQVVRALQAGKRLTCPSDQIANPTYGPDVALATLRAVEAGMHGIWHVAGPDYVDRVAFARAIARTFELDPALIDAQPTAELALGAPRPLKGGLSSTKLEAVLPGLMKGLEAGLAEFRAQVDAAGKWADPRATG